MDADLDTLATALYVRVDDALKDDPELGAVRPAVGIAPKLSDAELITLAVMQALLGFTSETRWLRHARKHLAAPVPLSARPVRLQQAAAGGVGPAQGADPGAWRPRLERGPTTCG